MPGSKRGKLLLMFRRAHVAEVTQEERRSDTFGELAERYIAKYAKVQKTNLARLREKKRVTKMDLCSRQGSKPKITVVPWALTCPAKAYQVEVEDSDCVIRLWPEIPAVFALNRLK
jgi:hypothetical protein